MLKSSSTALAMFFMLTSCLGIEQVITLNSDSSGSVSFTYRIARELSDLGSYGSSKKPLPLPFHRADFERVTQEVEGLKLASYSQTENEKDVVIRATVTFDSIEALDGLGIPGEPIAQGEKQGSATRLDVMIPMIGDEDIDEEALAMLEELSEGYDIVFTVRTPKDITESSMGEVSGDKRSVTYRTTVYDLARSREKRQFTIRW